MSKDTLDSFKQINEFLETVLSGKSDIFRCFTINVFKSEEESGDEKNYDNKIISHLIFIGTLIAFLIYYIRGIVLGLNFWLHVSFGIFFFLFALCYVRYIWMQKHGNLLLVISQIILGLFVFSISFLAFLRYNELDEEKLFSDLIQNLMIGNLEFMLFFESKMTELKELSSYLLSSIYNAISLIVLSFILSNKPSILQYVFTCVLSLFMSSFAQYMNPLSSISSYVYDTFFLIIWLVIPVSIKYYHDFITKKLEKQHKELKKIKFFYMTWLKNLNICYLLLKKEDVIFSNNHFDSINRTYFDEEHISPKDFFQKAFLFQTNVNVLENEKINLLECIKKVEVESKKDFIKIGSLDQKLQP